MPPNSRLLLRPWCKNLVLKQKITFNTLLHTCLLRFSHCMETIRFADKYGHSFQISFKGVFYANKSNIQIVGFNFALKLLCKYSNCVSQTCDETDRCDMFKSILEPIMMKLTCTKRGGNCVRTELQMQI